MTYVNDRFKGGGERLEPLSIDSYAFVVVIIRVNNDYYEFKIVTHYYCYINKKKKMFNQPPIFDT